MLCFSASRYFTISCSEGASVLCIPIMQGTIPCKPYPSVPCITSSQHRKLCQNIPLSKPQYILQYHTKPTLAYQTFDSAVPYQTFNSTLPYQTFDSTVLYKTFRFTVPYQTVSYPTISYHCSWHPCRVVSCRANLSPTNLT